QGVLQGGLHNAFQDDVIAFQLRISMDEWLQTKARFVDRGLISDDNTPCGWDKHQFVSDTSAARVARHREAKKQAHKEGGIVVSNACNVTVTPPETDTDTEYTNANALVVASKLPTIENCPHQKILALFAECLPELPQSRVWEGQRQQNLACRWRWVLKDLKDKGKPCDAEAGIAFFRRFFGYVGASDFLTGKSGQWQADMGWLVNSANFAKVLQGNYENRSEATA
ncbi:MAG: hypothetical protein KBD60_12900, partial [Sterolibacterium sp.]|nr:hypothetical protein [Sterolibacterium sp.]